MDLVEVNFDIENRHPWETARLASVSQIIQKYAPNNKSLNFLDVGSGDAWVAHNFTKVFSNASAYCVDIEYSKDIIEKINKGFNNKHLHLYDNLAEVSPSGNNIDFVTLLDVIEHVPDDVWLLQEIKKNDYIKDNTKFVITVPAYNQLFSQHDDLLKHYRRYNLRMLKDTIQKSGMTFVEGGYFYTSLIPPRTLQLLKEKIKKEDLDNLTNLGKWDKGSFVTKCIHNILFADFKFNQLVKKLGINLPGLSCYAVCSK